MKPDQLHLLWKVFQDLPFPIYIKEIQDDFRIAFWNQKARELWSIDGNPEQKISDFDLFATESAEQIRQKDREMVQQGTCAFIPEAKVELAGGTSMWLQAWRFILSDYQGHPQWLVGVCEDITGRKKNLEENHLQRQQIQSISDNAPGVLFQFRVTPENQMSFSYISRKFQDIFGMDPSEIMGRPEHMFELLHPDDRAEFFINLDATITERKTWHWQGRFLNAQGQILHIEAHSNPYLADDGCVYWDGMFQDLTALKEKERQLREQTEKMHQAARLVSIGEMAGGVAHEINTPLGAIGILAELAQKEMQKEGGVISEKVTGHLRQINDMVFRISKIIKALRSYARKETDEQHEMVLMHTILDEVLSVCNHRLKQEQVKVHVHRIPDELAVICHPTQISQVLLNLINNSCDAIRDLNEKWIRIEAGLSSDAMLEISLMDCGHGIPSDIADKLFENFFTTKGPREGTGMGLSMSRNIMKSHGGDLTLDRTSRHTRFVLRFPRNKMTGLESRQRGGA